MGRAGWLAAAVVAAAGWTGAAAGPPTVAAGPARRLPGEYSGSEPVVAADGEGRVVVAAIDTLTRESRIITWASADGGRTFGPPRARLADGRHQGDPWIHAAGPARFLLSFMGTRGRSQAVRGHLLRSEDGGQAWKSTGDFGSGPATVDRPVFAVSPNGRRVAAVSFWSGGLDDPPVNVRFSADGAATWAPVAWGRPPLEPPGASCLPTGVAIDDAGRTVVGYRATNGTRAASEQIYLLRLGVTTDGGRTWRRHDLGRLTDRSASPAEEAANIYLEASQVGLAQGAAGAIHVLTAQKAEKANRADLWYRRSADGETWAEPRELSGNRAALKGYPAVTAAGERVHAVWLEYADGWCQVCYRGSADGGNTWSARTVVSVPREATTLMTEKGFRSFAGHYLGVAEDGRGTAHVVWAVGELTEPGGPVKRGEVWHAAIRLGGIGQPDRPGR
jgi:hypothetical protein